jgi:hypothetical protein
MLDSLKLTHTGPADEFSMTFRPRLNLITGDNGLGKSFFLDVAWWVLTRTWAREPVVPHLPPAVPVIKAKFDRTAPGSQELESRFDREQDRWSQSKGRPPKPGLVLYAQVDGGFSVWDPERNYWKKESPERPPAYLFTPSEVWEGNHYCEGLIRDWASWQREESESFNLLKGVLKVLAPSMDEPLYPGELRKIALDDPKRYPTLVMPYGQEVPVIHASAGIRRIIALAYLLVWAWQEHREVCALKGVQPAKEVIFLIDEVEAHLHPQWQRRILSALLEVMSVLTGGHDISVQMVTATHSPLVLASTEPFFDQEKDGLFLLAQRDEKVVLDPQVWTKQGDVLNWLVSDSFGLHQGRSVEAERAIEAAEAWMRGEDSALPGQLNNERAIHDALLRLLPGHDPFWPRWVIVREQQGKGS